MYLFMIERKVEPAKIEENSKLDYPIVKKIKLEQIKEIQCFNEPYGIISTR